MKSRLAVAGVLLAALGCGTPSSAPDLDVRDLPATVTLAAGQQAIVAGSIVRFDTVRSDSRCPTDVVCVWEGNAEIMISVGPVVGERPTELVVLNTHQPQPVSAGGLRISLVSLAPAPVSTRPTRNYRVEIRLESAIQ